MTTPDRPRGVAQPLWSNERIATLAQYAAVNWDAADIGDLLRRVRDEYEADRAAHLARIAELEAQLISVSSELVSTSNADRYYRGFNDGFAHAESRIAALEMGAAKPSVRRTETGVRGGLIKGRIRAISAKEPSRLRPAFHDALATATTDDLMWALELLIKHPHTKRTWREHRIAHIDRRLREIMAAADGSKP